MQPTHTQRFGFYISQCYKEKKCIFFFVKIIGFEVADQSQTLISSKFGQEYSHVPSVSCLFCRKFIKPRASTGKH